MWYVMMFSVLTLYLACVWVVETKRRDAPDDYGMAVVQGMLWFSITAVITKLVLATAHSVATRGM